MADRLPEQAESDLTYLADQKNGDRMIKQLLNSVIAKYCDLSLSRRSIICLSLRLWQIIDLLATDKSQYFRASDRVLQKVGNSVAFSREIMRQERSIMH